jgi:hypothetical protein
MLSGLSALEVFPARHHRLESTLGLVGVSGALRHLVPALGEELGVAQRSLGRSGARFGSLDLLEDRLELEALAVRQPLFPRDLV